MSKLYLEVYTSKPIDSTVKTLKRDVSVEYVELDIENKLPEWAEWTNLYEVDYRRFSELLDKVLEYIKIYSKDNNIILGRAYNDFSIDIFRPVDIFQEYKYSTQFFIEEADNCYRSVAIVDDKYTGTVDVGLDFRTYQLSYNISFKVIDD